MGHCIALAPLAWTCTMSGLASHPNHFPIHQRSKIISPDTLKCNCNLPISISRIFLENKALQTVRDIFARELRHRSWKTSQKPGNGYIASSSAKWNIFHIEHWCKITKWIIKEKGVYILDYNLNFSKGLLDVRTQWIKNQNTIWHYSKRVIINFPEAISSCRIFR